MDLKQIYCSHSRTQKIQNWSQHCCCTETSIIGNDFLLFTSFHCSSTVPLPYRCSGVPSACVRLSTCRSLLGGVGVYIRWSCLFTVANAAVKLILILRFVAINFFACAQKTVARWVCLDQGFTTFPLLLAASRLFLWITAASEWKRFFAVLLPHVSLAVFLLSILIQ